MNRNFWIVLSFVLAFAVIVIAPQIATHYRFRNQPAAQVAQKVSVSCTYTRPAEAPTGTIEMWYVVAERGELVKKPACHRDVVNRLTCEREVLDVESVGLIVEYNYGDERVMRGCDLNGIRGGLTCTADDKPIVVIPTMLYGDCHFKLGHSQ